MHLKKEVAGSTPANSNSNPLRTSLSSLDSFFRPKTRLFSGILPILLTSLLLVTSSQCSQDPIKAQTRNLKTGETSGSEEIEVAPDKEITLNLRNGDRIAYLDEGIVTLGLIDRQCKLKQELVEVVYSEKTKW